MSKEKTYYDWLFEESEEEKGIQAELDAERERYENTDAYKEHNAKLDDLLNKLNEAGKKRREEARKHKPRRRVAKKPADMTQWKAEQEEIHRQKFESYPENLKALIKAYEGLDDAQKKVFGQETWCHHSPYDDYKDPQTTKEDLGELLEILIQDTIDFIKERGLKDIDGIGFGVDGLQASAKYGEWTPSSDANIYATGLGTMKGTDGEEYKVIQNIGELLC